MHMARLSGLLLLLAFLAGVFAPAVAAAQNPPPPQPRQEGTAEAAFVGTTGNSSTSTVSAGAEHIIRPTLWVVRNRALFVRSTTSGTAVAESMIYRFRAEREISARLSALGDFALFRDKPAGVDVSTGVGGGLVVKIVNDARQTLTADGTLGYLNEHRTTGDDISTLTYGTSTAYKLKLSDTSDLTDDFRLLGTFDRADDWRMAHTIALTAKINTVLSLKVSSLVRFANFPPPGFKKTDTTTAIALVAGFKKF
jgi:putative salt-induced outer membrane protein YdiY